MSAAEEVKKIILPLVALALVGMAVVSRQSTSSIVGNVADSSKSTECTCRPENSDKLAELNQDSHSFNPAKETSLLDYPDAHNQRDSLTAATKIRPPTSLQCSSPDSIVRHFVMTKIEKTGTSSLYSIFARFILRNKLTILQATDFSHINWKRGGSRRGWQLGPGDIQRAETMISHAIYDESKYKQYFVQDYKLIVPVRNPVTWIQSAASYFSAHGDAKTTDELILDDAWMFLDRGTPQLEKFFHLGQLQWLGIDYHKHKDNMTAISEHIKKMVAKIDIPVINDQFDASLVVMRRKFCWSYTDIFYKYKNRSKKEHIGLSSKAIERLLSPEVNYGDLLLYQSANRTWWEQSQVQSEDFWEEVQYFTSMNSNVTQICAKVLREGKPAVILANRWHGTLNLTQEFCRYLNMGMGTIIKTLIEYTKGTVTPS